MGRGFALIADTKHYWVGDFARVRSAEGKISYAYFGPSGDCVARRTKEEAGDLKSIGLMQTNNYRKMYIERVYGEMEAVEILEERPAQLVPAQWITRLPIAIESELAKFPCTIGLLSDGSIVLNHAEAKAIS